MSRTGCLRAAWLVLALAAALYCAWRFAGPSPLQTNLLALLPATEADPVAEEAVDRLAGALGNRAVFVVSSDDGAHAKAAARQLGVALTASGAFAAVTAQLPPFDLSRIARFYLPYRFNLLTPRDRQSIAGGAAALHDALLQRLYGLPAAGLTAPLADDPFGWLQHWLGGLPLATSNLTIEDGLLVSHRDRSTGVLVVATLRGSAYETDIQRAVLAAVAQGEAGLKAAFPDVTLARTGAVFYAEAARRASEREMHAIGIGSLVGVALLMLWIFRSPRLIALGFVSTALGILCALAATLLVFGQLHLLTLVFGASLIGEAVDYSIQYFVVYLGAGQNWEPRRGAREVAPALTVALATSLLGYAILTFAPFPALKQIACFAMVGIATAFASVLWLLPSLLARPARHTPRTLFAVAAAMLTRWHALLAGRSTLRVGLVAAAVVLVSVPGWLRLASDDDIHLLIQRDPSLVAQERVVTQAVGVDNSSQFFVVSGESPERVLERAEALATKLGALTDASGAPLVSGWQSVASFVPSEEQQRADHALIATHVFRDPAALRAMLTEAGFRDEVANTWLAAYEQSNGATLHVDDWLAEPWSQPFRHLWLGRSKSAPDAFAAVVIPQGVSAANEAALVATAHTVPGVSFVDKAASVSRLFGAWRLDSAIWLAGALLLVFVLLMLRYGLRGGIATGLPVLVAIGVTLAVFGYAHVRFTLFNSLALMLVLGVGANYAVFLREGALRAPAQLGAVWTGVLLSAATTLLSFGLLGMSSMPALKSFGATLSLGILVSVLLAPLGIPATQRRAA
ncbi:MMPL family transporter [Paraburkholderia sp. SUR17]|uniref:MMPL family transporter n=1 Tax=Paraburkholderia sp. SUR17 TaxID=3034358 RepID=UPI002407A45A|nr:MMPL family transporter [Paraburkholderia sp. SUR17]WEY40135.1 MMPL family transporter [Paraburkholderia sp. SUR17]